MAGHSQFKNIMHRKGAQDAKRAKVFTKIIRELTVAAREGGADPQSNPRLRSALISARGANMPKDTTERAIKRGAGGEDAASYLEIRYEGYGPGGVAVIVEALTDNRNRTAPEMRAAFSKHNGNLGEMNSVSFMFDRVGIIQYPLTVGSFDHVFESAVEAGADDVEASDEGYDVLCSMENFTSVRDQIMQSLGDPTSAQLVWKPQTLTCVPDNQLEQLIKLIDVLEDNDDVQSVFSTIDMTPEQVAKYRS